MSKELSMNGRKKVGTLQREFTEKFAYLTLLFRKGDGSPVDAGMSLSEVRTRKGADISIVASLKVDNLERNFLDHFGLYVEVAYSRGGSLVHVDAGTGDTLNEVNRWCEANGCDRLYAGPDAGPSSALPNPAVKEPIAESGVQRKLFEGVRRRFPDAVAKKIDKDEYVYIHVPSLHPRYGTHLTFDTGGGMIQIAFYCRDEAFVESVMSGADRLDRYSHGLRPRGNPEFGGVEEAVGAAVDFLLEIQKAAKGSGDERVRQPGLKKAIPKRTEAKAEGGDAEADGTDEQVGREGSGDDDQGGTDGAEDPRLKQILDALLSKDGPAVTVLTDPLIIAVSSDDASVEKVKELIERGADVNVIAGGSDAYTPVHYAAWDGRDEILQVLLDAGGNPNAVGGDGSTPLHLAASLGRTKSVELLLQAGAEIDARGHCTEAITSSGGDTALRLAFVQQQWPVIDLLEGEGADLSNLLEPCSENIEGSSDLFDVVRNEGNGQNRCLGEYDEERTNELEKRAKGFTSEASAAYSDDRKGDYLSNWQLPSTRYSDMGGLTVNIPDWIGDIDCEDCCPRFNDAQLQEIARVVQRHKLIPVLEYAPSAFLEHVKRVWWIVPFSVYRETHASWIFIDKNGIHAAYDEDNQVRQIVSWENVDFIEFKEDFFDGDDNVNVMFVHLVSGGYITFAEFANEVQGSYMRVLVAIFNVRKATIEKSRGKDSWKEGAGGEGFQAFQTPSDLLDEKVWLNEPSRPDPRFFM